MRISIELKADTKERLLLYLNYFIQYTRDVDKALYIPLVIEEVVKGNLYQHYISLKDAVKGLIESVDYIGDNAIRIGILCKIVNIGTKYNILEFHQLLPKIMNFIETSGRDYNVLKNIVIRLAEANLINYAIRTAKNIKNTYYRDVTLACLVYPLLRKGYYSEASSVAREISSQKIKELALFYKALALAEKGNVHGALNTIMESKIIFKGLLDKILSFLGLKEKKLDIVEYECTRILVDIALICIKRGYLTQLKQLIKKADEKSLARKMLITLINTDLLDPESIVYNFSFDINIRDKILMYCIKELCARRSFALAKNATKYLNYGNRIEALLTICKEIFYREGYLKALNFTYSLEEPFLRCILLIKIFSTMLQEHIYSFYVGRVLIKGNNIIVLPNTTIRDLSIEFRTMSARKRITFKHVVCNRVRKTIGLSNITDYVEKGKIIVTWSEGYVEKSTVFCSAKALSKCVQSIVGRALNIKFSYPKLTPLPEFIRIDDYICTHLLKRGGISVTLLAIDKENNWWVLKVPLSIYETIISGRSFTISEDTINMFEREYCILKRLKHPHIVRVGERADKTLPFIPLEYCKNGSLRDILNSRRVLSLRTVLKMGIQIADAVEYAHSQSVVHGDLKPENILFNERGVLKVSDFNTAKIMRHVEKKTVLPAYTKGYASPEQVNFEEMDEKTDTWSLGIILYEALTGVKPYLTDKYEEELKQRKQVDFTKVPAILRDLVKDMLSYDKENRPSAKEIREELAEKYLSLNLLNSNRNSLS
ncbi:MAG: hypothetical protein DRJ52_06415 [Thermoprotei archaeon]|nr:MAG: hypothetical protein DRJ52_06415 [Thermoprotei archaeon]